MGYDRFCEVRRDHKNLISQIRPLEEQIIAGSSDPSIRALLSELETLYFDETKTREELRVLAAEIRKDLDLSYTTQK